MKDRIFAIVVTVWEWAWLVVLAVVLISIVIQHWADHYRTVGP